MAGKTTVTIEYGSDRGYLGRAASLAELVLRERAGAVTEVALVPSSGDAFEVTIGDTLVHSRKDTGRHPSEAAILAALAR